jgi:hypothetical protein
MTHQRGIEDLLDLWLGEGSSVAPDRVLDVVTDRIERQRQRGAWRFPRRDFHVPALLRLAAVAAALALAAAGAIYFGGSSRPNVVPETPGPSPTVVVSPPPSPSPYVLPSGLPYPSAQTFTTTAFRPGFRINLPVGWAVGDSSTSAGMILGLIHTESGDSGNVGGSILLRRNPVIGGVGPDCPDQRTAPPTPGPTTPATAIVAALLVDRRFTVVAEPTIAIDGRSAQVLDVRLAPDFTGACMGVGPSALLFDEPGSFVVLENDRRVRVILLDVDAIPLLILIWPDEEAYDAFVARAMPLIQGITFLP